MTERDHDEIRELLQDALPPSSTDLRRDLWPAMSRAIDSRMSRIAWYDWALASAAGVVLTLFPDWILVLLYHL